MLTDIVARLRDPRWTHPPHSLLLEAAGEIERLRKSPDKDAEIARLQKENDQLYELLAAQPPGTSGQRSEESVNK